MQLFFGWEGVGLASYLLIGFWFHKPTANAAAIKAFVVNRVGDFGFALGIMTVFWMFGSIEFAEVLPRVDEFARTEWAFAGVEWRALDIACLLLFVGAMGKSAQFFLHTWLPDAMEGPTPVSALIHAATMVTAGVYMVCLLAPMFELAPAAKQVVTIIGAVTALFAATVGLAQNDIKRVIAYSTCSQLGYMFFAAGVGAYQAAMFHLFTHAFFKALLFLGAGSVIHGMHHEQDMRRMGGLMRYLPLTFAAMTIGNIAIAGFGVPHVFGFAGFYSKDSILEAAYAAGGENPTAMFAFVVGVVVAALTAFYSFRLAFMTFNGPAVWKQAAADGVTISRPPRTTATTTPPQPRTKATPSRTSPVTMTGMGTGMAPTPRTKAPGPCWSPWGCCRSAPSPRASSSTSASSAKRRPSSGGAPCVPTAFSSPSPPRACWRKPTTCRSGCCGRPPWPR
jgi:NADH-quinone oxidoreductase subunit L